MAELKLSFKTTTTTTAYNMCLNGGSYHLGLGCLCVGNFGGDFCDECLPDWIGDNCETPKDDICTFVLYLLSNQSYIYLESRGLKSTALQNGFST